LRRFRGPSCEIASDLCPKPFSHDWHVQPNFQRPNRLPPERREFSPEGSTQVRLHPSSKPYNHTLPRKTLSTHAPHRISTCFPHKKAGRAQRPLSESQARNGMVFRFEKHQIPAQPKAEDRKLRKELTLEVLALKVPFRNLLVFPNQAPWPGRLRD